MQALIWVIVVIGCAAPAAAEPLRLVRIETDRPLAVSAALRAKGLDADHGHTYDDETGRGVEIVVSAEEHRALRSGGLDARLVRTGRPLRSRLAELNGEIPNGYSDWAGVLQAMHAAATRNPAVCEVVDLTARYGTPPTHEGRHIVAVRISDNVSVDEEEPAVLIVSAHHSREIGTPVAALRAIDNLVDGYGVDSRITQAIDSTEIWIAPVWNPDGYEHVYNVDDFWRKNRRDNGDGTFGVDLNRNYPIGWGLCNGSQVTGSQVYEGLTAGSEPETQTMLAFTEDRRFARVADIHSFGTEVVYGYGCWDHPWDDAFQAVAANLSDLSGYEGDTRFSCCLGGDIHNHMSTNGALAMLWEIGTGFHPSFASADAEADDIWNGLIGLIDMPVPVSGRVSNASTGAPVEAEIELLAVPFAHGERHRSAPRHGLYHAFPPEGSYIFRFTAHGFEPVDATAVVSASQPATLDIAMTPLCRADVNGDGAATPADFNAWVAAFNGQLPACDQNGDGDCTPGDFNAWVLNYNAGCP
ncbi:MAG: M14 family zinc carboxypeptidase [Planctomycetota bacterium]